MGKLTNVKRRLQPASRRLPAPNRDRDFEKRREAEAEWRGWYKTAAWQRKRWSILVRDQFTCQFCGRVEANTSQLVADHKRPHRGDAVLFWDDANLQCLCSTCHDSTKQRMERARR